MSSERDTPCAAVIADAGQRVLASVADTHAFAAEIARGLHAGDVIALVGDLGAGKTEFTRGLAHALGVPAEVAVCSPSYLGLNLYRGGRLVLAHFDAYFLGDEDDLQRAGLPELLAEGAVAVVEWADRVTDALPVRTLWLELLPPDDVAAPADTSRLARWQRGGAPGPVTAPTPATACGPAPAFPPAPDAARSELRR